MDPKHTKFLGMLIFIIKEQISAFPFSYATINSNKMVREIDTRLKLNFYYMKEKKNGVCIHTIFSYPASQKKKILLSAIFSYLNLIFYALHCTVICFYIYSLSFLLSDHILCKKSIVIRKKIDIEIYTYLYGLKSPEFVYAIF